jgi:hypothetical protein
MSRPMPAGRQVRRRVQRPGLRTKVKTAVLHSGTRIRQKIGRFAATPAITCTHVGKIACADLRLIGLATLLFALDADAAMLYGRVAHVVDGDTLHANRAGQAHPPRVGSSCLLTSWLLACASEKSGRLTDAAFERARARRARAEFWPAFRIHARRGGYARAVYSASTTRGISRSRR